MEVEKSIPKTGSSAACKFRCVHPDSMTLSWVIWNLVCQSSYCDGFQTSKDG